MYACICSLQRILCCAATRLAAHKYSCNMYIMYVHKCCIYSIFIIFTQPHYSCIKCWRFSSSLLTISAFNIKMHKSHSNGNKIKIYTNYNTPHTRTQTCTRACVYISLCAAKRKLHADNTQETSFHTTHTCTHTHQRRHTPRTNNYNFFCPHEDLATWVFGWKKQELLYQNGISATKNSPVPASVCALVSYCKQPHEHSANSPSERLLCSPNERMPFYF